jgi:hypothetical protein
MYWAQRSILTRHRRAASLPSAFHAGVIAVAGGADLGKGRRGRTEPDAADEHGDAADEQRAETGA